MRFKKSRSADGENKEDDRLQFLDEEMEADAISEEEYGFELGYYSDY